MRQPDDMTTEYNKKVLAWIEQNRKRLRMPATGLSKAVFGKDGWIAEFKRKKNPRKRITHREVTELERFFGEKFMQGTEEEISIALINQSAKVVTLGHTIGGGFREQSMVKVSQRLGIPASPVLRYMDMAQEAWRVEGDSAYPLALDGSYVLVVDYFLARPALQAGDEIVIKRYHPILFQQNDHSQTEHTIRLVIRRANKLVLRLPSDPEGTKDILHDPNDGSVIIEKLIIGYVSYKS